MLLAIGTFLAGASIAVDCYLHYTCAILAQGVSMPHFVGRDLTGICNDCDSARTDASSTTAFAGAPFFAVAFSRTTPDHLRNQMKPGRARALQLDTWFILIHLIILI